MPYGVDESGPFTCIQHRQKPAIIMAQTSVQIHRQPLAISFTQSP